MNECDQNHPMNRHFHTPVTRLSPVNISTLPKVHWSK